MKALLIALVLALSINEGLSQVLVRANPQPSRADVATLRAKRQAIRHASLEEKVNYLLDRAEIADLVTAYAYSVDMRDWVLHDSIFTEEVEVGSPGESNKILSAKRVEALEQFFKKFTATQHLGFPLTIDIEGDRAYVTASLHARHFNEDGDPAKNTLLFGQYEYWLVRTETGWRINRFALVNRTRFQTTVANKNYVE